MVIDTFTFNGENDILKLHLGILYNYVDKFIIVEANKTFSGQKKPMYFFRDEHFFRPYLNKIQYYSVTDWDDVDIWDMALQSPQTQGASHWKREFYIKESIQKALSQAKLDDEDTVFIGDVDEIVNPLANFESETPIKAKLDVYSYYLNNRSSEQFWGTLIGQYKDIKGQCLNHMRSDKALYSQGSSLGWHFTSMGGADKLRQKLTDSYTDESYATQTVLSGVEKNYGTKDFLGRDFTYTLNEEDWPQYLKDNRDKFKNLIK